MLNLSTGNTIASSNITLSYNSATNTATYSIPYAQVPDGNYQATLSGSLIYSGTLHLIGSDSHAGDDYVFTNNFFFVTGDLNHDAYNNFTDLNTLAQNYGLTNASYAQGDTNYDGTVGVNDLLALEQTYRETVDLPVPGGLSSPTQTPTTALLVWQPAISPTAAGNPTVTGYNVYRNGNTAAVATAPGTAFLDTGLTQQTTYTYTLRTTDSAADISLPSHPVLSVTTPAPTASNGGTNGGSGGSGNIGFDTTPPDAPTNLTTAPASIAPDSGIIISWSPSEAGDVASYLITRNGVAVAGVNANTYHFTDSGLTAGASYTYGVVAFDGSANQSAPATVTATVGADVTPPSEVVDLSIASASSNSIKLTWLAATDNVAVDHYIVTRESQQVATISATSSADLSYTWVDTSPPTPSSNFYSPFSYTVTAVDAAGNQTATMITVPVADLQQIQGQVSSDSANQYIPSTYQRYFYDGLVGAFRQLLTPASSQTPDPYPTPLFMPIPQNHWYDRDYDPNIFNIGYSDPLVVSGQLVNFQEGQSGWYPSNHIDDPQWRIPENPDLLHDQYNPIYYSAVTTDHSTGYPPVWLDSNHNSIYDQGDTVLWDPDHMLQSGQPGRNFGISSYAVNDDFSHLLIWFESGWIGGTAPPGFTYSEYFRSDLSSLYFDINKLAGYYPDPLNEQANQTGNAVTKDTIAGLLGQLRGMQSHDDQGIGTISIDQFSTTATLSGGDASQFRPGDSVELGSDWYLLDWAPDSVWGPSSTTIHLAEPYLGHPAQSQPFSIRNWTLLPDATQQPGSYFPSVTYARGQPGPGSILFPEQFTELAGVLSNLGKNPDSYSSTPLSQVVTTPLPLTSELDYQNVVPDTDLDGIVQVPQEWTTSATATGFISLEPDRTGPQIYLPLEVDRTDALPVHAYISQGGFGSGTSQPLLTQPAPALLLVQPMDGCADGRGAVRVQPRHVASD